MKQLKPARNMRIKNHVTPKGKALNSQLSAKFGITLADFEKACMGDLSSIQRIGELSKQATFMTIGDKLRKRGNCQGWYL